MGRMYSAAVASVAGTVVLDFFEIVAPSDAIVVIHGWRIGQHTEEGDAQAEMLQIKATKGATTSGSGGSAVTPTPLETGMPAFGGTVEAMNTTPASGGTPVTLYSDAFNVQGGHQETFTPEMRIVLSPGERFVLGLAEAPADSVTFDAVIFFEEIGG